MSAILSNLDPLSAPRRQSAVADTPTAAPSDVRLSHLFRGTLKQGRIHPLYVPLLKYRQTRAEPRG